MTKGFWAVSDQGLLSLSNFVLNVLLARWLSQHDYGAFAVAFAIFTLLFPLHAAMLTEPMLVFGPGRYKDNLSEYLGALVYGHLGFATLGSLALLLISMLGLALWGSSTFFTVLLALALATPFVFLLYLVRRACYIRTEPHLAALGGALYMVLILMGVSVFRVRATDGAGNQSEWAYGPKFFADNQQETSGSIAYSGVWTAESSSSAYGGGVKHADASGAVARFAFTGRNVAWFAHRGPDRGNAEVWIDGVRVKTVDLCASSEEPRKVIFSKGWSTPGSHTLV